MPCGTERSEPVQILKITPVLPGAMTEKELVRLTRRTTAARPTSTLLVREARRSRLSRIVVMGVMFLPVCSMYTEIRHVDGWQVSARPPGQLAEQIALQSPLNGAEQKVDGRDARN